MDPTPNPTSAFTEDSALAALLRRVAGYDDGGATDVGARFDDHPRFTLRERLGQGGFGVVYRAWDARLGVEVALKALHRASPGALHRFKGEFRQVQGLAHPHLVRLHELFCEGEGWYFTMDLVPGDAWGRVVARRPGEGPGPVADRLRAALPQLVDGLSAMHRAGLIHRDLKPSNVHVTPEGRVVLLDFGLASLAEEEGRGDLAGTPSFMAPEVLAGQGASAASDLYALGVMIHLALTGGLPELGGILTHAGEGSGEGDGLGALA